MAASAQERLELAEPIRIKLPYISRTIHEPRHTYLVLLLMYGSDVILLFYSNAKSVNTGDHPRNTPSFFSWMSRKSYVL